MTAVLDRPPVTPEPEPASSPRLERMLRAPLWAHVLALVLVLAVAAPFVRVTTGFTVDEGSYGVEQRALAHGGFAFHWAGTSADAQGRWFPLASTVTTVRGRFPYMTHPAYPAVLRAAARLLGERAGLGLVPLAGLVGTAVAAWLLAGFVDDRLRAPAFWVAVTSPVLVNGWVLWAHAPSAALAGFSLVAVLRAARGRGMRSPAFAAAAALTIVGALLRSENVLFGIGAAVAFVVVAWPARRRMAALAGGAVLAATGVITTFVEARWIASIVGAAREVVGVRREGAPLIAGRVTGALHSVLTPSTGSGGADLVFLIAAVLLVLVVVFRPRPGLVVLAAAVVLGLVVALVVDSPTRPVTGLLAAWPVALPALGAVAASSDGRRRSSEERAMIAAVAILGVGVLASQYDGGGGIEWGGRFFSPALAPLAVLVVVGCRRLLERTGRRTTVAGALVALATVPAVCGLVVLHERHRVVDAAIAEVTATHPAVVVTHSDSLARNAWRTQPAVTWYLVPPGEVGAALAALRSVGVSRVTLVEPADLPEGSLAAATSVTGVPSPLAESAGRRILKVNLR